MKKAWVNGYVIIGILIVVLVIGFMFVFRNPIKQLSKPNFDPTSLCINDVRFITDCRNSTDIFYITSSGAVDLPLSFYNSYGKFITTCGGMPSPNGVESPECSALGNYNCSETPLINCTEKK